MSKKAQSFRSLIALGVFITVISIMFAVNSQRLDIEGRTLGTTQAAILAVAQKADESLIYLDEAARLARDDMETVYGKQAGTSTTISQATTSCGSYYHILYWQNDKDCTPNFQETASALFNAHLQFYLDQHPIYAFPDLFTFSFTEEGNKNRITGRSGEMILSFAGDGLKDMARITVSPTANEDAFGASDPRAINKAVSPPDYADAERSATLAYDLRGTKKVNTIVVHALAAATIERAITDLQSSESSYHYLIDNKGSVFQLVPESRAAHHVGSCSAGEICPYPDIEASSIAIAFLNDGPQSGTSTGPRAVTCLQDAWDGCECPAPLVCECKHKTAYTCWSDYTQEQFTSFSKLVADLSTRHPELLTNGKLAQETIIEQHRIKPLTHYGPGPLFIEEKDKLISDANTIISSSRAFNDYTAKNAALEVPEFIGPVSWCQGSEKPPVESMFYGQLFKNAKPEEEGNTYYTIIAEQAITNKVDAALLTMHAITASGLGLNDQCWESQTRSRLTGCSWSCIDTCNCNNDKKFTAGDWLQLDCTANADKAAYYEATTGETDQLKAPFENCKPYAKDNDLLWSCIICTKQGAQESFLKDKTCDGLDSFKQQYCSWNAYYQGKGVKAEVVQSDDSWLASVFKKRTEQTNKAFTRGGYIVTYDLPLQFSTLTTIDIKENEQQATFAQDIVKACIDDIENCASEQLDEYNKQAKKPLSTECVENKLLDAFLKNVDGCKNFPENVACSFTLEAVQDNPEFVLETRQGGLYLIAGGTEDSHKEPVLAGAFVFDTYEEGVKLSFPDKGSAEFKLFQPKAKVSTKDGILADTTFTFTKDNQGRLALTFDHTKGSFKPYQSTHVFCEESVRIEEDKPALTLAQEFMEKIRSCNQLAPGLPCTFALQPRDSPSFIIKSYDDKTTINTEGADRTLLLNRMLYEPLPDKDLSLSFFTNNLPEEEQAILLLADQDEIAAIKLQDAIFTFTKNEQGELFIKLSTKTPTSMRFAVRLTEEFPPTVQNAEGIYYVEQGKYELRWEPVTAYKDLASLTPTETGPVTDILTYEVYCTSQPDLSSLPINTNTQSFVSASALTVTINRSAKEERYDPELYKGKQMTVALKKCGTIPLVPYLKIPLNIVIIAKDAAGLYSFDYTPATITIDEHEEEVALAQTAAQLAGIPLVAVPVEVNPYPQHTEYANEVRTPQDAVTTIDPISIIIPESTT